MAGTLPVTATRRSSLAIFTRVTESTADVSIFARTGSDGEQALAIQLRASFSEETALVVPLPVARESGSEGARFIPMQFYLPFFRHLDRGFAGPAEKQERRGRDPEADQAPKTVRFAHAVPTAMTFVPSVDHFERLCPEHAIPEAVLLKHGSYADYGFAVFVFPRGRNLRIAPLGLRFRTREPEKTFFPTVAFGGGVLEPSRAWDHTLYCQRAELSDWEETGRSASEFVRCEETQGIVEPGRVIQRRVVYGTGGNADIWL